MNTRILILITLLVGCASSGQTTKTTSRSPEYEELGTSAMTEEVQPFVEDKMLSELMKDADAVDYPALRTGSLRIAFLFRSATEQGHAMYDESEEIRTAATKAAAWLTALSTAAEQRNHKSLVKLYTRKKQICTQCHE